MNRRLARRDDALLETLIEQARRKHEEELRQARFDAGFCALVVVVYAILAITGYHP